MQISIDAHIARLSFPQFIHDAGASVCSVLSFTKIDFISLLIWMHVLHLCT